MVKCTIPTATWQAKHRGVAPTCVRLVHNTTSSRTHGEQVLDAHQTVSHTALLYKYLTVGSTKVPTRVLSPTCAFSPTDFSMNLLSKNNIASVLAPTIRLDHGAGGPGGGAGAGDGCGAGGGAGTLQGPAVLAPLTTPCRTAGQPTCKKRQQRSRAPGPLGASPYGTYVHDLQRASVSHVAWQSSATAVLFTYVL